MGSLGFGFSFIVLAVVGLCSHPEVVDCKKAKSLRNNKSISTVRFLQAIRSKFSDFKNDINDIRTDLEKINKTCNSNVCEFIWDAKSKAIVAQKKNMKYAKNGVCSAINQILNDVTSVKSNFSEKRKKLEQKHNGDCSNLKTFVCEKSLDIV